ncbi:hypothetical protein ACFVVC_04655 [Pseudarthrobacter sp. NPDC058196]|uniref:hypothetical protein n=1 Tax=Pseudarthrobacter sp. NPDC058196 TaxID=3346376 RepID=UPI0036DA3F0C
MELVTSMETNHLVHLTAPEFAALVQAGSAADVLFEGAFETRLGRARELKSLGALWLAIRHDAMPEAERGAFPIAIKRAIDGLLTAKHLVSWVPFHGGELRSFVFFGPVAATVVSLTNKGLLDIRGLNNCAALDMFANTVTESNSLRFVVTAKELEGAARVMAWQDNVLSDRRDGATGEEANMVRHDAANRIVRNLAAMICDEQIAPDNGLTCGLQSL